MRWIAYIIVSCLVAAAGYSVAVADTPLADNESRFLEQCHAETLHNSPRAITWVDKHCASKWQRAENATPMVEAIFALVPNNDKALSAEAVRSRLPKVQWSSEGREGVLNDLAVYLPESGRGIIFDWQRQGMISPYNIIDALLIRNVTLHTLGCPQYAGASMGQEKVMAAELDGRLIFLITVYSRPAPTGIEQGLYQVAVDFNGTTPDITALQAGHYPGGGGRAFATEPTGWLLECPDPD